MSEVTGLEPVAEGLAFPEGPVVMADGSVIVVELAAGRITRCWNGRTEVVADIGGGPNGAAIGPDGALYVCNNGGLDRTRFQSAGGPGSEGRIERVDLATGRMERLYDRCGDDRLSAPNDLVFAADGSFWFTDMGKNRDRTRAMSGLYHAAADGTRITEVHHGAISFNGVGLSPDGATVYVADTFQARLYAFDAAQNRGRPRLIATMRGDVGLDSLAVTAAGNICVGQLHTGGIAIIAPDGATDFVPCPDKYTTNIAFGGEDMRTAWITQSTSGRLIRTRWREPGLRLAFNA